MTYYSQAKQDEFVANILNFKRNGYYLDIGCGGPTCLNNSYFFELELNWKGICVDTGMSWTEGYNNRNCIFLNEDATKIDYKSVFIEKGFPTRFDYLSVDVDDDSLAALKKLPFDDYRFSVITIEHDAYRLGDSLRNDERAELEKHGYVRLFSDVMLPIDRGGVPNCAFEDWWIDPAIFDMYKLKNLVTENFYADNIVDVLKNMPDTYYINY
jgi:hypothetical protein